jgi:hypothetical protein
VLLLAALEIRAPEPEKLNKTVAVMATANNLILSLTKKYFIKTPSTTKLCFVTEGIITYFIRQTFLEKITIILKISKLPFFRNS